MIHSWKVSLWSPGDLHKGRRSCKIKGDVMVMLLYYLTHHSLSISFVSGFLNSHIFNTGSVHKVCHFEKFLPSSLLSQTVTNFWHPPLKSARLTPPPEGINSCLKTSTASVAWVVYKLYKCNSSLHGGVLERALPRLGQRSCPMSSPKDNPMEHESRSKVLSLTGFEPRTSWFAVQDANH